MTIRRTAARPLYEIAEDIRRNWGNVYFGAVPYLEAMFALDSMSDSYGMDDARSIVAYFLSNATTWRGEDARRIKAELNSMLKTGKTALYLTNVGVESDEVGIGTDPSGNRVRFSLSPQDAADLKSVLYSDLAVNFSGVTVDESDIISEGRRKKTGSKKTALNTPWGVADNIQESVKYPGVKTVDTPSHGGIFVPSQYMDMIPSQYRSTRFSQGGWFEEDVDAKIPLMFLPGLLEEFNPWYSREQLEESWGRSLDYFDGREARRKTASNRVEGKRKTAGLPTYPPGTAPARDQASLDAAQVGQRYEYTALDSDGWAGVREGELRSKDYAGTGQWWFTNILEMFFPDENMLRADPVGTHTAKRRALNEQSGDAESDLDDVEVDDDNADEEPMFPWEIKESPEETRESRLNVWAQNGVDNPGESDPPHVEVTDPQAQESMFDEGWAEQGTPWESATIEDTDTGGTIIEFAKKAAANWDTDELERLAMNVESLYWALRGSSPSDWEFILMDYVSSHDIQIDLDEVDFDALEESLAEYFHDEGIESKKAKITEIERSSDFPVDEWRCDNCGDLIGWVLNEDLDRAALDWYDAFQDGTQRLCEACAHDRAGDSIWASGSKAKTAQWTQVDDEWYADSMVNPNYYAVVMDFEGKFVWTVFHVDESSEDNREVARGTTPDLAGAKQEARAAMEGIALGRKTAMTRQCVVCGQPAEKWYNDNGYCAVHWADPMAGDTFDDPLVKALGRKRKTAWTAPKSEYSGACADGDHDACRMDHLPDDICLCTHSSHGVNAPQGFKPDAYNDMSGACADGDHAACQMTHADISAYCLCPQHRERSGTFGRRKKAQTFPGAGAQVYYNEAGEPMGWDYPDRYEPDYYDDDYIPSALEDAFSEGMNDADDGNPYNPTLYSDPAAQAAYRQGFEDAGGVVAKKSARTAQWVEQIDPWGLPVFTAGEAQVWPNDEGWQWKAGSVEGAASTLEEAQAKALAQLS